MAAQWEDLKPRLMTAAVMAVVGIGAIWLGGVWFLALVAVASGVMIWELARMIAPEKPAKAIQLGVLGAASVILARFLPIFYVFPVLAAPGLVGMSLLKRHPVMIALYGFAILLCGYVLIEFRHSGGVGTILWMVLVVIASDVAGYFAGRSLGGPKFWPAISPKKTWSGTVAGWVGAAAVALAFAPFVSGVGALVLISVLVAFAAQMGDIAESAIKRKLGVKDSSNILPGHGGLMDRFDGLIGAALCLMVVAHVLPMPVFTF